MEKYAISIQSVFIHGIAKGENMTTNTGVVLYGSVLGSSRKNKHVKTCYIEFTRWYHVEHTRCHLDWFSPFNSL